MKMTFYITSEPSQLHFERLKRKKLRNIRRVERHSSSRHSMHDLILEIEHIESQHIYQESSFIVIMMVAFDIDLRN